MKPCRVLLIGLNYAPEPVGIGPYSQGLAEALAARGAVVSAVVGKPYYPQWRTYPGFRGLGWATGRENGVRVVRCPVYVPADPAGARRILHLASFALAALPAALRAAIAPPARRPAVVIAVAPALFCVATAWLAARLAGAKLWIHVQDFEVEAALATGLLPGGGIAARLARWIEARLLRLGDRVSAISPQMCARLAAKGVEPARVIELRNWSDALFAPDPDGAAALRRQWNLGDRKVALYSGNIARKQGIEILVEAARLLRGREDLVFVMCGEGPNRAALERLAAGLPNLQLRDLQPASQMGALLNMADVHLLPQIAGAADLVLPSKLANMLASGRPVLATSAPGTGLYQEVEGCGVLTPPGDAGALAAGLAALIDDPRRREALGAAALERARRRWAKDAVIDRLAGALEELAGA